MRIPGLTRRTARWSGLVCVALWCIAASAAPQPPPPPIILTVEGTNVWVQRVRANTWEAAYPNQILQTRDRGRTGRRSQTTVRLSDLSVMRINERSEFEIQPLPDSREQADFSLWQGLLYLLHRDRPGSHRFRTPTATAATRGTEFTLQVEEGTGRTTLTVLEGEAELSNPLGTVLLATGEQGVAAQGQPPMKTAVIDAINVVQWFLYYPAILNLNELALTAAEQNALNDSLAAYRRGDLLGAVAAYPDARQPGSDGERVYLAALLLSVGQVTEAEALLEPMAPQAGAVPAPGGAVSGGTTASRIIGGASSTSPAAITKFTNPASLASALELMIAAVKLRVETNAIDAVNRRSATELLALSYAHQSFFRLREALASAQEAAELSPDFAFAWARLAELEFSHGSIGRAKRALDRSLELAPRNAQAHALQGFLLAAENRMGKATAAFQQATALDGGLGNAWLGRGLCQIRRGQEEEGRFDLQLAAALEPQRASLRSYLGKAFSNAGDEARANKELLLAEDLDPRDPTASLYLALLRQQQNRINEAVRDLERSQELNDNRRVYRSSLLLDQDRAVRGANLATIYRDAGLVDLSVREAGRAVNTDYANYSAHLFLANSFNQLRDPKQINLRYETAWFSEYLLANLLAPVGAGTLSQSVSQQEYSKLFERDRLGFTSSTEYFSHGEWVQDAVQYGTWRNSSYAAEAFYHVDNGHRPNNDLEQLATILNLKQQIAPADSLYLRLSYYQSEAGDVNQYYDERQAIPNFRSREHYEPLLLGGYHHEWNPGNHTLLLAGYSRNRYEVTNPSHAAPFLYALFGPIGAVTPIFYNQERSTDLELYNGELQQVLSFHAGPFGDHTMVIGGRYQRGQFDTMNELRNGRFGNNPAPDVSQFFESDLERQSAYIYDQWQIVPQLLLVSGLSYDRLTFPLNHRYAPITEGEETRERLSPKLGFILNPAREWVLRGAYYRGLGGASLDQSFRIEPSQVAGFNQAYRSLIPESVAGASSAETFESWTLSLEHKVGRGTFLGLAGEILSSEVDRTVGAIHFTQLPPQPGFSVVNTREELDFREQTLYITFDQLLGREWAFGVRYRLSHAELEDEFPDIPSSAQPAGGFERQRLVEARLQQAHFGLLFNHPSGFFSRGSAIWSAQSNHGYTVALPGDEFWQFNIEGGYRFARRRAEVRVGLLNITDQDYRLNPLNLTAALPRGRTLAVSLLLNF